MAEYIDRHFVEYVIRYFMGMKTWAENDKFIEILATLGEEPAADVVPVIRCKDCRYWFDTNSKKNLGRCVLEVSRAITFGDDFCSDGEPKEDPENEAD